MISLQSYIKDSKECFIRYLNTSKSVKKLGCTLCVQSIGGVFTMIYAVVNFKPGKLMRNDVTQKKN